MRISALLLMTCTASASAQDAGIQREIIQRQQATDAFNLQMHQSQDALRAAPADRRALESRQFAERQRLSNLSDEQLRDVKPDAQIPPQLRPYELQKADAERAPFRGPVLEVPAPPTREGVGR